MNHNTLNINMDMGFLDMDHVANMRREFFINKDYEWWDQPQPGDVVVDVGTCVGMFSCLALDSGASKVYMIEPNKHLLDTAMKNTSPYVINQKDSKVVPCHAAIMHKADHITHIYDEDSAGDFKPLTFMEFVEFYDIKKIDYLKIDCEGGEYGIFNEMNMPYLLENVKHMAVEFHLSCYPGAAKQWQKVRDKLLPQ